MTQRKPKSIDCSLEEQVGYKKPPAKHRFKKGHKGNPHGCKGKPNSSVDFLDERERVFINGKHQYLSREELLDRSLFKEAMAGSVPAARELKRRRATREAKGGAAFTLTDEQATALERATLKRAMAKQEKNKQNGNPIDLSDETDDQ